MVFTIISFWCSLFLAEYGTLTLYILGKCSTLELHFQPIQVNWTGEQLYASGNPMTKRQLIRRQWCLPFQMRTGHVCLCLCKTGPWQYIFGILSRCARLCHCPSLAYNPFQSGSQQPDFHLYSLEQSFLLASEAYFGWPCSTQSARELFLSSTFKSNPQVTTV